MTPTEFLDLSTRLCRDLKAWTEEMSRADKMPPEYLESLKEAYGVIERVTLGATAEARGAGSNIPEIPTAS